MGKVFDGEIVGGCGGDCLGGEGANLEVVLVRPEIPPNTGNIGRLCLATGCRLHLVGPLGFSLDDKSLRRAGLDYWKELEVVEWSGWGEFEAGLGEGARLHLFTTKAARSLWEVEFRRGDYLVFGRETAGLDDELLAARPGSLVRLPMRPGARSLNLSSAAAAAVYEGLRQVVGGGS
jgi:tRNA (cytidine/uridine-2'-O-)-methyltransferase